MRVCLMVEGQEDQSWEDWVALADACEANGFEALFRSDHYLSVDGVEQRGALDAWTTLAALAAVTSELRLGTLVSPATFRHPSVLARCAVTVDHVSRGRVEVGLGAGWYEAEHERFGFALAESGRERFDLLAEQLEIVRRSWEAEPFSFAGEHYRLTDADPRPKPVQQPRLPLIVGGSGRPRGLALAARWADEYNTVYSTADECRDIRRRLDEACEREGRDPIPLSLMIGYLVGGDRDELHARAARLAEWRSAGAIDPAAYLASLSPSWIAGTPDELVERLEELEAAGVQRVMLQHHLYTDFDALALIGAAVIPRV